jgi:precorrin-6A/cobalt-precorrin-6A reductase
MVDEPDGALSLPACEVVTGKPGRTIEEEMPLFERLGVDVIVSRNSGGRGAYAKIEAARRMGLPVIMIDRPNSPKGDAFADVEAIAAAIG